MGGDALFELATPDDFSFPFEPCLLSLVVPEACANAIPPDAIQLQLMRHVFSAIEQRKIALVESPTGTGKSLSLICSTLSWIRTDLTRTRNAEIDSLRSKLAETMVGEPMWVIDAELERKRRDLERQDAELEARLQSVRKAEEQAKANKLKELERQGPIRKKQKVAPAQSSKAKAADEEEFAPEDVADTDASSTDGMSTTTRDLMRRYHGRAEALLQLEEEVDVPKIYYASRTHSQLSQFMGEVRKTTFADARTIPLGSRANLCINEDVKSKSKGTEDLNERCLDLQKKGKERCPFLPAHDDPVPLNDFRDHALASVHAIEDLEELGRQRAVCPYYGARRAIKQAQLVTLPYQMLLSATARESLGISLTEKVVVIDEAHALIDTILNTQTVSIDSHIIASALKGCVVYHQRFSKQLKGSNAANLKQLHAVLLRLNRFCTEWKAEQDELKTANEVIQILALDQVPLRQLDRWMRDAKMARKIAGYAEALEQREQAKANGHTTSDRKMARTTSVNMFHRLQSFLLSLTEAEKDGRILVSRIEAKGERPVTLKYLLFNPETVFKDIVDEARAVVLAGGTMAPMLDFEQQLFSYLERDRLATLTCSHVVPADHLLVRTLGFGPSGTRLELKYDARGDPQIMDELGQSLINLAAVISAGCVCFLPSYTFLDSAMTRWKEKGILARLTQKKQVFTEPKTSGETDGILRAFAEACAPGTRGSIMLAVIGAKLSEGINFSDNLCRCVVVVSIPYPSLASVELKERMAYITNLAKVRDGDRAVDAGKVLYSNLAFRAVNQAIGRAIRHRNDWAAIILLDARYSQSNAQQLLPAWIRNELEVAPTFGAALKAIATFMKARKPATNPLMT